MAVPVSIDLHMKQNIMIKRLTEADTELCDIICKNSIWAQMPLVVKVTMKRSSRFHSRSRMTFDDWITFDVNLYPTRLVSMRVNGMYCTDPKRPSPMVSETIFAPGATPFSSSWPDLWLPAAIDATCVPWLAIEINKQWNRLLLMDEVSTLDTYNTFRQFPKHFHRHVRSWRPRENRRCFWFHAWCCIHLAKSLHWDCPNDAN